MTFGKRILKACNGHWSRSPQKLASVVDRLEDVENATAVVGLVESLPISHNLLLALIRQVERNPLIYSVAPWLRFMERHYVFLLESDVFAPRLSDAEALACITGLHTAYSYFPDRVFTIDEERHVMLCTRALVDAETDAKVNQNTGHAADQYFAIADYRWLDSIMDHTDKTKAICQVLATGSVKRVAELEMILENPDVSRTLLDGAL